MTNNRNYTVDPAMQAAADLEFDDVTIRLIEMGHGRVAIPIVESAVIELLERDVEGDGFELDDLLSHLRDTGQAEIAALVEQAVSDLVRRGGPVTARRMPQASPPKAPEVMIDDILFEPIDGFGATGVIPAFRYLGEVKHSMAICSIACGPNHLDMMQSMSATVGYYAAMHGMDSILLRDVRFDDTRPPAWDKVIAIRSLLEVYESVLWIDSDAIICDPDLDIRSVAPKQIPMHIVAHEYDDKIVPNTGVWMIHRSDAAIDILEAIWASAEFIEHAWWENAALMELIGYDPRGYSCEFAGPTPFTPLVQFIDRRWNSIGLDCADDPIILHYAGEPHAQRMKKLRSEAARFFERIVPARADPKVDGDTSTHSSMAPIEVRLDGIPNRNQIPAVLNMMGLTGVGVEVGVKEGEFSEHILSHWRGAELISVDPWLELEPDAYVDIANVPQDQHEEFHARTVARMSRFADRSTIWRTTSLAGAEKVDDGTLDFVYLDARHDYISVLEDLEAWFPKVKTGGIIAGHDYLDGLLPEGDFGVRKAVDEFFAVRGLAVHSTVRDQPWASWVVQTQPSDEPLNLLPHEPLGVLAND